MPACSKKSGERSQNDWINTPPWGIVREFPSARGTRRYGAMALSMDEQRMLAEIERRLAAQDPGLATRLSTFRRPGPAVGLRTTRGKIIGSICTIVLLAVIGITIYAMTPFRAYGQRTKPSSTTSSVSATSNAPAVRTTS